jgi:hypothetical protein
VIIMLNDLKKTFIALLATLAVLFVLLMLYMIASGDNSLFAVLSSDQPVPRQSAAKR